MAGFRWLVIFAGPRPTWDFSQLEGLPWIIGSSGLRTRVYLPGGWMESRFVFEWDQNFFIYGNKIFLKLVALRSRFKFWVLKWFFWGCWWIFSFDVALCRIGWTFTDFTVCSSVHHRSLKLLWDLAEVLYITSHCNPVSITLTVLESLGTTKKWQGFDDLSSLLVQFLFFCLESY